jgi:hypothetical protein
MKSGVQMNFLERRVYADRALLQIVRMAREATPDTLSSREQRGVFRLEAMLAEKSSAVVTLHDGIASPFAARWAAFWTVLLTTVYSLGLRAHAYRQRKRRRDV